MTIGVPPVPQIGSGATVDATGRVTDTNGCSQQVVRITFDALPPMRAPGAVSNRYVENRVGATTFPCLRLPRPTIQTPQPCQRRRLRRFGIPGSCPQRTVERAP